MKKINILGKPYKLIYVNSPYDVDIARKEAYWGQTDEWTREIRIYKRNRSNEDIFEVTLHEIIHSIADILDLGFKDEEKDINALSVALADTLTRNNFLKGSDYEKD